MGHTVDLRERLRARREAKKMSRAEVARLISNDRIFNEDADRIAATGAERPKTQYGETAVANWELLYNHPPISAYAAWARVLGMRLHVELADAGVKQTAVLMPDEAREAAEALRDVAPADLELVRDLALALKDLAPDSRAREILAADLADFARRAAEERAARSKKARSGR
jgi:transcriptional regulator with XRE-family HTH domain